MGAIWFVTGTDTGIGKTMVSTALTLGLRAAGRRALGVKPLETGCRWVNGALFAEDAHALALASGAPPRDNCLYRLEPPLAPSVASRLSGTSIDLARLVTWVREQAASVDDLVVEGAGGLMVPLTDTETFLDLIRQLEPTGVLLVAMNRLGVLNQVLTSAHVLKGEGIPLRMVVLNQGPHVPGIAEQTNLEELMRWKQPVVSFPTLEPVVQFSSVLSPVEARTAAGLALARAVGAVV